MDTFFTACISSMLIVGGVVMVLAAWKDWDAPWMKGGQGRWLIVRLGRDTARRLYGGLGVFFVIVGVLFLFW